MSNEMPKRDISGDCEGECRDLVEEGEMGRQSELEKTGVKAPPDYPNVPGSENLDNPDNLPPGK